MHDDPSYPERPHPAPESGTGGEVGFSELLSGVEEQLARLREMEMAQRLSAETATDAELRLREAESREMALNARELDLENRTNALRAEAERLERSRANVVSEQERIEALERELDLAREKINAAADEGLELAQEAERERDALADELGALRGTSEGVRGELDEAHNELRGLRAQLDAARSQPPPPPPSPLPNEEMQRELDELRTLRASLETNAATRDDELRRMQRSMNDAQARLEQSEASRSDLVARLELAELAAAGDEEARRIETLSRELNEMRSEVARARDRAESAESARAESESKKAALEIELTETREKAEADADPTTGAGNTAMAMRVKAMQQRINKLESQLAEATTERGPASIEKEERREQRQVQVLERRVAQLERELEQASSGAAPALNEEEMTAGLRRKAEALAEIATHLKQRQVRLRRARMYLERRKDRMPIGVEARQQQADAIREVETKRHALLDHRHELGKREKRMVRRWACARAVTVVGWLVVITLLSAGASWAITSKCFPAVVSATANLEAKWRKRAPIPAEEAAAWQQWHVELLEDRDFLGRVAKRLDERKIVPYGDRETLTARLAEDLTVDRGDLTMLTLTLEGRDSDELTVMLDIISATMATESTRLLDKRPGEVWAVSRGERLDNGELRASAVNPIPVRDDRLMFAAPIFGGTLAVVLVIVFFLYRHLTRVKREFDEDDTLFEASLAAG